ncbi:MAG TPA: SMP-30/gluconolactonase/LRE family protein [Solirubrobacteraceae bacterium]|nr:SMP-30/gluconolactonase/LRE family protein [Solirubrobacteraceae bacterium]
MFATAQGAGRAYAATAPLSDARVVAHFDITKLQQPENITLAPGGAADVTFNRARQVARVGANGSVSILATLPAPATGTATAAGIVRGKGGFLYVDYNAGSQSGIWRIPPRGGTPVQVVATPGVKVLNGLAIDPSTDTLYATDSTTGTVWKVSLKTGTASLWARGPALEASNGSGISANGIKVHAGAVWVSNTDKGTLLRIPIGAHGAAGAVTTMAKGITSIDDFTFTGRGNAVLAAEDYANAVALVNPNGTHHIVLTSTDGISNPTSIAVRGSTAYVTSGAYFTRVDPNLLVAKLR